MIASSCRRFTALSLGLPLLLLAACTQAPPTMEDEAADPATDAVAPEMELVLSNDGLQVVDAETGSTRTFPFGGDLTPLEAAVTELVGAPAETGYNEECPGGPLTVMVWDNGLALNSDGESFVGWSVRPVAGSETLTTMAGVGIGSTRSDLEAAYDVDVFGSSLGVEFYAGQLAGLLSDSTPEAMITDLWAGEVCIFR